MKVGSSGEGPRADLFLEARSPRRKERLQTGAQHAAPLQRKLAREGEDEEVALTGGDHGEKAAVGRNGEIAEGEAVKDGTRKRLGDGDFFAGLCNGERRNVNPHDVAGFFFEGAFEEDAIFVRGPLKNSNPDAEAGDMIRRGKVANLEDFSINKVSGLFSARGNGEAADVSVESGEFRVFLRLQIEMLEARRAGLRVALFDGDGCAGVRDSVGV